MPYRLICQLSHFIYMLTVSGLPVCDYPGEPENGRVIPLKFTYEPGDRLKVTCFDGFVTRLETKLICKSDGTWSQPLPECRNYTSV